MIAALLRREFRTGIAGDEAAEHRLLALELARLVIGVHPVGDFVCVAGLHIELLVDWTGKVKWQSIGIVYSLRTAIFRDDLVEKRGGILEAVRNPARRAGRGRVSNAGERNNVKSISRG